MCPGGSMNTVEEGTGEGKGGGGESAAAVGSPSNCQGNIK